MKKIITTLLLAAGALHATQANNEVWPPVNPTDITIKWTRKPVSPGQYICEGTATATYAGSGSLNWQIVDNGDIVDLAANGGKGWVFGYIEPQPIVSYTIQVRAAGSNAWYSEAFAVPKGCITQ